MDRRKMLKIGGTAIAGAAILGTQSIAANTKAEKKESP